MKNFILIFLAILSWSTMHAQGSVYQDYSAQGIMNASLIQSLNNEGIEVTADALNGKFIVHTPVSLKHLVQSIANSSDCQLRLKRVDESRLSKKYKYHQYNQYHNNIRIDGGFISLVEEDEKIVAMYPKIFEGIQINTFPSYSVTQIENSVLNHSVINSELVISPRFGNYKLIWEVLYHDEDKSLVAYVDAQSGEVMDIIDRNSYLLGTTQTYGTVNLNDSTQNGVTSLTSPDGNISIYSGSDNDLCDWDTNDIPTTTNTTTWDNELSEHCAQAYYATSEVVPAFECLGIDFGQVNVDCVEDFQVGLSTNCSTIDDAYIFIGVTDASSTSLALFDVMGHELGHSYLNTYLGNGNLQGNSALQEGIADVLGTYVEAKVTGNLDWVIGDDEDEVADLVDRDLSEDHCFNPTTGDPHTIGLAMGHWAYLMSEGSNDYDIDGIGLQAATELIIDALPNVGPNAGFTEMSAAILDAAAAEYGTCSNELQSAINAWGAVCVTPNSIPQPLAEPPTIIYSCGAYAIACVVIDGYQTSHPDFFVTPVCVFSPNGTVITEVVVTSRIDPSCTWVYENISVPACHPGCPGVTPTVEYVCTGNGFESCALIDNVPVEDSPWQIYPECNQYSFGQEMIYNLQWKADNTCNLFFETTLPDCTDQVPCEEPELTILCNIFGEACLIVDGQSIPNATWGVYTTVCVNTDLIKTMQYHIYNQSNTQCEFIGSIRLPECGFGSGEGSTVSGQLNDLSSDVNDILLSPNPAIDVLNVAFENEIDGAVQIFDVSGKIMFKKDMKGSKLSIDLSQMNAGMYFISVNDDLGRYSVSKKFIKARF